jgi:hypothetical protein
MFARLDGVGNQYIVYSVEYSSPTDVALILPIPVVPGDASVQFVPMDCYDDFFNNLASGFVAPSTGRWIQDMSGGGETFAVQSVRPKGAFYVPTFDDFARLDLSLRPSVDLLDKFPNYRDFGFVVLKLPSTDLPAGTGGLSAQALLELRQQYGCEVVSPARLSPIAFRFASREPRCVYFPLTIFEGDEYKPIVEFDHTLYLQHDKLGNEFAQHHVGHVSLRASNFMRDSGKDGVVHPRSCCFRRILRGSAANQDLWVYPSNAAARVARWLRPRI